MSLFPLFFSRTLFLKYSLDPAAPNFRSWMIVANAVPTLQLLSFLPRDALQCKARYCERMSSVCPSVKRHRRTDRRHALAIPHRLGRNSWKLIARTISPTPSLFVAQRPSTYSQGNMGKFLRRLEAGWEKSGVLEQKSGNTSKMRKNRPRGKVTMYRAYRNAISNGTTRSTPDPLWPPLPQDWGFETPPNCYYYSTDFKIGYSTFAESIWIKTREKGAWDCGSIQGLPKFCEYPLLLAQERVKLWTLNFVRQLKIFSKSIRGRTQGLEIFRAPIYRAHCAVGHLCGSSAFLSNKSSLSITILIPN